MILPLLLAALAHASDYDDGVAALVARRPQEAAAAFSRCAAAEPSNVPCRWELGWAYVLQRDWDRVIPTWEEVLRLEPRHPEAAAELDIARAQQKLRIEARAALARARTAPPRVSRAPESATLRLRAVGDIMLGSAFPEGSLPPDDGASSFSAVASLLRDADLTLGNLEGPLCDTEALSTKCKPDAVPGSCYAFRTPTRYAPLFPTAGFDVLTVANNHANDFGPTCRDQTAAAFAPLGVALTGRPGVKARRTVNGLEVTVLGFHTGDTGYNLNDAEIAAAVVAAAAAESDLVVVTFHGGAEGGNATRVPVGREFFRGEDRGDLRAFARAAIDAGADVVIGHGPHVLRGMEIYKDRLIAYSLGNFATFGRFNLQGDQGVGAVLEVSLARDGRWLGGKVVPTLQEGRGTVRTDPQARALTLLRTLSPADFGERAVIPDDSGALVRACAPGVSCR